MRPTHAEINLTALKYNIQQISTRLPTNTKITAVVKANAYGHGAVPISKAALAAGANALAVAIPEEGIELREANIQAPILVLGISLPDQAELYAKHNLTATVCTEPQLKALAKTAKATQTAVKVMLKIDTGMSRIGIRPEQTLAFVEKILAMPELNLRGIYTHLATADEADNQYSNYQMNLFKGAFAELNQKNIHLPIISAANSASIMDFPSIHFNTVRAGIILYGLPPSNQIQHPLSLRPVMQLKTKICFIKEVDRDTAVSYGCTYKTLQKTILATLPIGYADGYSRSLSNNAEVLIGGKKYPIVGRVCMDQCIVDLGPNTAAQVGDDVVLFGSQGSNEITVTTLASLAGTINYELVCGISPRVPRIYIS